MTKAELRTFEKKANEYLRVADGRHYLYSFWWAFFEHPIGLCYRKKHLIEISYSYGKFNTYATMWSIFLHEVAHAIIDQMITWGELSREYIRPHGPEWESIARRIGSQHVSAHAGDGDVVDIPARHILTCKKCGVVIRTYMKPSLALGKARCCSHEQQLPVGVQYYVAKVKGV